VLRQACRQRAQWNDRFGDDRQLMRVNISPRSFADSAEGRAELIIAVVADAGLAGRQICLELTEHALASDSTAMARACRRLQDAGMTIALDDFGTGFSSIPHLKTVPADVLKIDRSFVAGLDRADAGDQAIVASFVSMAAAFGLQVVAEGVQSAAQVSALVGLGCHRGQGHLIGEAAPAAAWEQTLADGGIDASALREQPGPTGPAVSAGRADPAGGAR
jgi:EAL domain-containing protein (putative c-di-GMP-specific phosphodiesterase class I)